ncbi:MAG: cation diffusion facilitator family transporter [Chitinophagales bacterium]
MEEREKRASMRAQQWAIALGLGLLAIKIGAYLLTHSTTILADALEGIVNIVAGCFSLFSIALSAKPRDHDHPYGHGKVEFLSAGLEGMLIIIASILIVVKAVFSLQHPEPPHHLDIGIILVVLTGIANYVMGEILIKRAHTLHSLPLEADGRHLKTDAYTSAALVAGLLVIYFTQLFWLDAAIAIIAATMIAFAGWRIVRKSLVGIMDETDVDIVQPIVNHLHEHRAASWIDLHNLRVIQYGSTLHLDCHITFPWYWNLEQVHQEIDVVDDCINQFYPRPVEVFIHPDPCLPECCRLCRLTCDRRQHAYEEDVPWTLENVIANQKHRLHKTS